MENPEIQDAWRIQNGRRLEIMRTKFPRHVTLSGYVVVLKGNILDVLYTLKVSLP